MIGIIGGSGLYNVEGLKKAKDIIVKTPFGAPSDKIKTGEIGGVKVAFVARHGRDHRFLPTEVPYRANIYAMKKLGAKIVLAFSAVGSLKEKLAPKDFVFPDQHVDNTKNRDYTFFGNGVVGHAVFADPFCNCLGDFMYKRAKALKIKCHRGGTIITIEGPHFSTKAESNTNKKLGYSLIGMTASPEAKLAREAGLSYVPISMVTDCDCLHDDDIVSAETVMKNMETNVKTAKKIILDVVPKIGKQKTCGVCNQSMRSSVMSSHKKTSKETLKKLKVILD